MTANTFPPASAKVLDIDVGIEAMGSEDGLRAILETVLESMSASLPDIRSALQAGDVPAANALLHAIKGYMPLLTAQDVVDHVTAVEGASKTESAAVVAPLFASLEPTLQQLLNDIQTYLADNPAD